MNTNRYPGICSCGTRVAAGDGYYETGNVYCDLPVGHGEEFTIDGQTVGVQTYACPTYRQAEARRLARAYAARATATPRPADPEVVARRAAEDEQWAARGLTRCDRCGGVGGHQSWPGFTCYDCGGHGAVPHNH
jgi:hypothetical protein